MTHLDPLADRILAIQRALDDAKIPSAFGGAIVLFFFGEPRTTGDIDLNVFIPSDQPERALAPLSKLYAGFATQSVADDIRRLGQVRVDWEGVPVDLFFVNLPFLESAAARARAVSFAGSTIRVLSPEDLLICKAMFNRRKDWADIEQLLYAQRGALNLAYIREWLAGMVGEEDPRMQELETLIVELDADPAT